MKKIIIVAIAAFFCCQAHKVFAFDWKTLHEQADTMTVTQAESRLISAGESVENLYLLGLVYLNEHKDKEARDLFMKLSLRDSRQVELKWGMAEMLRREHKTRESEQLLQEIIAANSSYAPAYLSLAYIKYLRMDFSASVKLAFHVLNLGREKVDLSNYVRGYLLVAGNKGMLAHYGGLISKVANGTAVLPYLKKAQALQPNNPDVLFGLGNFYLLAPGIVGGNSDKAIDCLEKAIKADANFTDAYVRLAQAYRRKNDIKKFDLYIHKALAIDPQNTLAIDAMSKKPKFIFISEEK